MKFVVLYNNIRSSFNYQKKRSKSPVNKANLAAIKYVSNGMMQKASHGLKQFWIFFYQKEKLDEYQTQLINELKQCGFNMEHMDSIKKS